MTSGGSASTRCKVGGWRRHTGRGGERRAARLPRLRVEMQAIIGMSDCQIVRPMEFLARPCADTPGPLLGALGVKAWDLSWNLAMSEVLVVGQDREANKQSKALTGRCSI